jgi:hypothetical protein
MAVASSTATLASTCIFGSAEVLALTGGALGGATRSEWDFPDVLAIRTFERSHFGHFYHSSFDSEGHALNQDLGHLLPGRLNDPAEGLSRDAHLFGGILLIEPLIVGQPQRLVFVHRQFDFLQSAPRHARRLQEGEVRSRCDSTAALWSWQFPGLLLTSNDYRHMLISSQARRSRIADHVDATNEVGDAHQQG